AGVPDQRHLRRGRRARRPGRLRGAQRRAVEGVAGDHRALGAPAGRRGLGRQAGEAAAAGALTAGPGSPGWSAATKKGAAGAAPFPWSGTADYSASATRSASITRTASSPVAATPRGSTAET